MSVESEREEQRWARYFDVGAEDDRPSWRQVQADENAPADPWQGTCSGCRLRVQSSDPGGISFADGGPWHPLCLAAARAAER